MNDFTKDDWLKHRPIREDSMGETYIVIIWNDEYKQQEVFEHQAIQNIIFKLETFGITDETVDRVTILKQSNHYYTPTCLWDLVNYEVLKSKGNWVIK